MDPGELWGDAGEIPQWRVQWDELTKGNRLHVVLEMTPRMVRWWAKLFHVQLGSELWVITRAARMMSSFIV